ncbi:MAG TPA: protease pro-enzyme activation domain-containing protein [Bryobacteraceae bacterium]|nr:protease pro-enzyme activation domain-containing protein [Bryobacteraceae bacterium]
MRIRTTLLAAVAAAPVLFAQTARHSLPGQLRPGVTAANDRGRTSATRSLRHVTLNLRRSGAQEAELQALLARQQDPSSPDFHNWLTPEQFAGRFGLPQADIDRITSWLKSQNLTIDSVDRGRTALSFSGSVRNVEQALQVEIHDYVINGVAHFSNSAEPSVPSSLGSFIASVRGLDDFRMKPRAVRGPSVPQPRYTSTTTGAHYLGPDDLAKIFDISPLYNSGITGKGQKIVVVGQTQINLSDIEQFRTYFNLPQNDPTILLVPKTTDPGVSADDLAEADLDVEWSGAVARDANIIYVYSEYVTDALDYAVSEQLAPVISMSYGLCEQASNQNANYLNMLAEKAAVLGISWIAASGDNAANDCYGETAPGVPSAPSVDVPASTPMVTGVGGTTLTEGSGSYWNSTNNGNHASALSYIPENAWNDSILNGSPDGSGGGASKLFQKPSWQTGPGVPDDGKRDVPDIAMPASPNHDPYMVYTGGVLSAFGGTSVGAPVVAGITGLLNQYLAANAAPNAGPLNPTLYSLAQTAPGAFHDITVGDNITVACPQSTCGTVGFTAAPGYDQTTGLGSLDVFNFVTAWPATLTVSKKSTSVALSPSLSSLSSLDTTTLTATVSGSNGVAPTGNVSFYASGTLLRSKPLAGSDSTASAVITVSAADLGTGDNGSVVVSAVYNGDGVYGTGAGFVTVTVPTSDAMALTSVTSAASFQKQYAPGMIVALFGSNFASGIPAPPPAPLPTQLGGTTVTINGIASPLYYVSPTQINVQIPWEIPKNSTAVIKVASGARSATTQVFVNKNAPEIFGDTNNLMVPYQTTRPGDPAFLFVTGDGLFSAPSVVTGAVPPSGTVTVLPTSAKVTVGGVAASVLFIGEPSWSVGVSQINFTIPANAPLGKQPVIVTIGGVSSSPVYITVSQ